MEFEFDLLKSAANKEKHGIDFITAQQLWLDVDRVEIPARTEDEPRSALIAQLDNKLWTAIFTGRQNRIRLISVRRAREKEIRLYES